MGAAVIRRPSVGNRGPQPPFKSASGRATGPRVLPRRSASVRHAGADSAEKLFERVVQGGAGPALVEALAVLGHVAELTTQAEVARALGEAAGGDQRREAS